jgi:malate permease and related proteins
MDFRHYITTLHAVVPVFLVIGLGIFFRRRNWLSEAADGSLLRLTNYVLLPCLIFNSILFNLALKAPVTLILAPVFGFLAVSVGMGVAFLCARYAGRFIGIQTPNVQWTFVLCAGVFSYSFMPLALAKNLFGQTTTGVLLAHNLGVELAVWTLGLMVLRVVGAIRSWKRIFTAPVIATLAALIVNVTGLEEFAPQFLIWSFAILGQAAIPLGLILIGVAVADHLSEFRAGGAWKLMASASILRLLLVPLLFLLAVRFMPFPPELKKAILLQSAMPSAAVPLLLMVRHYGGDFPTAMRIVLATTAVSVLTMPLWIYLGRYWVGLD